MYEVPRMVNTALIDQDYQMIDAHIDEQIKKKIQNMEYVDLGKLLQKNRTLREEDHRMEIVSRNRLTFLSPIADRDQVQINSYMKWEQSFRIYSNILTSKYPSMATELLQYNHTIHSASSAYIWENVYAYNKELRHHIARHPQRSWAIILQQPY